MPSMALAPDRCLLVSVIEHSRPSGLSFIRLADQVDKAAHRLATSKPLQVVGRRPLEKSRVESAPNRAGKSIEGLEFIQRAPDTGRVESDHWSFSKTHPDGYSERSWSCACRCVRRRFAQKLPAHHSAWSRGKLDALRKAEGASMVRLIARVGIETADMLEILSRNLRDRGAVARHAGRRVVRARAAR